MDYNYRFTDSAEEDLDDILSYISVQLQNGKAAAAFYANLESAVKDVCHFPESGSLADNEFIMCENVRRKYIGNYIMYYLPDDEKSMISILRIIYKHRDMSAQKIK